MSFVAVAIGGSAIAGVTSAFIGANAAKSAADTQAKAAQNSLDFQKSAFNTSQGNFKPFINAGTDATYSLSKLLGTGPNGQQGAPDYSGFMNSPDYQFAQSQGQKGVINAANAQGVGLSGGTLKDLSTFNSGLASQQYGNYFQRLMNLSQMGANAASGAAGNATTASANIGNTTQAVGQAQASGTVGAANAITGGINSGVSNSLLATYLGKSPSAYTGAGAFGGSVGGSTGSIGIGNGYQMPTIGY